MLLGEPENTKDIPKQRDFGNERRIIDQDSGIEEKRKRNGFKAASSKISVLFHVIKKQTSMSSTVDDIIKYEKL